MSYEQKKRQVTFWKKHQNLLKLCSELSNKCGAKILCVITYPDEDVWPDQQQLNIDRNTGNYRVANGNGTAVIFDSFSPEGVVAQRNPIVNSISKIHDTSRQFLVNFNVNVVGKVSAVLSQSTVESYCVSDRRAALLYRGDELQEGKASAVPLQQAPKPDSKACTVSQDTGSRKRQASKEPIECSTAFEEEIERRKRQCLRLFEDLMSKTPADTATQPSSDESWSPPESSSSSPNPLQNYDTRLQPFGGNGIVNQSASFASVLSSHLPMPVYRQPLPMDAFTPYTLARQPFQVESFAPFNHVYARFTSPPSSFQSTPSSSYETISLCTVPKRDLLTLPNLQSQRNSNEELAISTLSDLLHMRR